MALQVTIAGIDKSNAIDWPSLSVEQVATSETDKAVFNIKKYGTKTYSPTIGQEVKVYDGASTVFGGTIVRINNRVEAGGFGTLGIECVSHERTLDRYLVAREIQNKNGFYVLNTIFAEFVNRTKKVIASGESGETWTTEDGTVAPNTTAGEFVLESQSRKFTASAGSTATARIANVLNLTLFDNGQASTTSDLVSLWIHVDNASRFSSLRIRLVTDAGATYTNYFEYTYSTTPRQGLQQIVIAKSAFSSVGSPSWSNIQKAQFRITANGSGSVNVSIDDVRILRASEEAFTLKNVTGATQALGSVKFNYEQVSQALKQIAEAMGFEWYIDPDRDLYFYEPSTITAPFSLTDTSGNFVWDSLELNQDITNLRNQIYVRGGEYEGSVITESKTADGNQLHFTTPYKMKNVSVAVAGNPKSVGVDNLDDPASYDCLYNFNEKTLKFKAGTKPAAGEVVAVTGNPKIPVIIKKTDATSVSSFGVFEYVIVDKSITTLQGGRDRAAAELKAYRDSIVEGRVKTYTSGLRAGQTLALNIAARGISDSYRIKSLIFRARSFDAFEYEATLVSTRTFGIIEYLLGLIRNDRKQIELNDNEVSDLVQDIAEEAAVSDAWTQGSANSQAETVGSTEIFNNQLNHGTIFVAGPYVRSSFADTKRVFITEGSRLG